MNKIIQEKYRNFTTEELVARYQSTESEDILREILRRNTGLLRMWAKDYGNIPYYSGEDLIEEANIACWKAVGNYSPERETAFSTFLKVSVHRHFNRIYAEVTRQKRYTGQEASSWEALEEIHKEKSIEFELLSDLEVQEFLNTLEGKVKFIAISLFRGYSKGDVARALGITPASTSYHIKRLQQAYIAYRGV